MLLLLWKWSLRLYTCIINAYTGWQIPENLEITDNSHNDSSINHCLLPQTSSNHSLYLHIILLVALKKTYFKRSVQWNTSHSVVSSSRTKFYESFKQKICLYPRFTKYIYRHFYGRRYTFKSYLEYANL